MKKKLLVLTICFTLIFSSFNYRKSYADGGVISLPMLAVVSSLAVGTGIIINNSDDLYDLGRMFYDYIDDHNDFTWSTVQTLFNSCVALQPNNLVSVKSDFLDIVKDFFDNTFNNDKDIYISGIPGDFTMLYGPSLDISFKHGKSFINIRYKDNRSFYVTLTDQNGSSWSNNQIVSWTQSGDLHSLRLICDSSSVSILASSVLTPSAQYFVLNKTVSLGAIDSNTFPYKGGYTWDDVESKKENESVSLPIPGNLGNLVGQGSSDFWDNTDDLVGSGDIFVPGVENPSIGLDGATSFPSVDSDVPGVDSPSVPGDSIWSTIKEFIIGLVVPSDSYWTDTWGGLYNNFTSSFPMVDMDGFNDLVTGEKKFPNIDVDIMGVKGRVVNGDVVNSIVDWLRPIIAGFMMLCLMLFNYRKIYKLIRNSEPFGGIAPGTSDFSTGISEYNKESVVKAVDMASEYRAWKERGGK